MLKVGLTGGLATGKSFVGQALADLGCHWLQADELGHQVLLPEGEAYHAVVREFGPSILDEQGRIDRRRLAAEVFSQPDRLAQLNRLIHPLVIRREEEWLAQAGARDPRGIAVVEAAILIETGSYRRFDRLVLAVCRPEQQVERSMKRDGIAHQEAEARLARQMPLEEKRKFADFVIDTSGSKKDTLRQVGEVHAALRRLVL